MESIGSFNSLLFGWKTLPDPGRLYISTTAGQNIAEAQFWAQSSAEAKEMDFIEDSQGRRLPVCFVGMGVRSWLEVATFKDIVEVVLERQPAISLHEDDVFRRAIEYYLEFDTFEP